jgi:signal transduction histidine kinase
MDNRSRETLLERYLSLLDIAQVLASTLDLDRLLYQIVMAAANLTASEAASIILYDESKNRLFFQSSTDLDSQVMRGLEVPVENSIAGEILRTQQPIIVMNTEEDSRHFTGVTDGNTEYQTKSLMGVPLMAKDKIIGVLEVINKKQGEFSDDDQNMILALGSQAAISIENTRLFQQSDLISEMVHELRTPLASIQTAAHLLGRVDITDNQRTTMIQTIQSESSRLSEMTTSFLEMARLESGRTMFNKDPINLETLIEETAILMEARIKAEGLHLKLEITPPIPIIAGDKDKIKQVLINLISNAIKYNRPNGTITLGASKYKDEVSFYVRDTGIGMKPEHVKNLFTKFYRVPGSEKVAIGTGLGLSITKRIVEGHGGTITVDSQVDVGTTFVVSIPVETTQN